MSDIKYEESKRARDDARARVAMGKSRGDQTTCAAKTARRQCPSRTPTAISLRALGESACVYPCLEAKKFITRPSKSDNT